MSSCGMIVCLSHMHIKANSVRGEMLISLLIVVCWLYTHMLRIVPCTLDTLVLIELPHKPCLFQNQLVSTNGGICFPFIDTFICSFILWMRFGEFWECWLWLIFTKRFIKVLGISTCFNISKRIKPINAVDSGNTDDLPASNGQLLPFYPIHAKWEKGGYWNFIPSYHWLDLVVTAC